MDDLDRSNCGASAVGKKAGSAGVRHQGDIGQVHDLPDAVDVGIGLGVNEAGIAVAGIAANAFRGEGTGFVAFESKRNRKGVDRTQLLRRSWRNGLRLNDWQNRTPLRRTGLKGKLVQLCPVAAQVERQLS